MIALADLVTQLQQQASRAATDQSQRQPSPLTQALRDAADRLARLEALMPTMLSFTDVGGTCVVCGDGKDAGYGEYFEHTAECWLRDLLQLRGTGEPG